MASPHPNQPVLWFEIVSKIAMIMRWAMAPMTTAERTRTVGVTSDMISCRRFRSKAWRARMVAPHPTRGDAR